jgi:UDP-perosamine 4-acetyltransferase
MTTALIVIVGAGDHARVIVEAIRAAGTFQVVGYVDPDPPHPTLLEVPVLGDDNLLPSLRQQGIANAVVALGSNAVRGRVGKQLHDLGFALPVVAHPTASISPSSVIGAGVVVMARAVVGTETRLDDLAVVNTGAVIDHDNRISFAAHVAPGCALAGRVSIGARTLVGVGSAVRPGIVIGADVIVGAGSAVVSDIPDGAVVGGAPARFLQKRSHP